MLAFIFQPTKRLLIVLKLLNMASSISCISLIYFMYTFMGVCEVCV